MSAAIIIMIAVSCVLAALSYRVIVAKAQGAKRVPAFVANPDNTIRLSVRGWGRADLGKILADFSQQYGLPDSAITIDAQPGEILVATFPSDIEPKHLFFLVNYIQYPKDFDLERRSIGVAAHVVLTPAFGAPDDAFVGKRATIYVPADDTEYDLVFAQIKSGKAYQISFTDLVWQESPDARVPAAIRGL